MKARRVDWAVAFSGAETTGLLPEQINGVYYDSRAVIPGSLFVAVPGALPPHSVDGHDFIADALERGAAAVLVQTDRRPKWAQFVVAADSPIIAVQDSRRALAAAAAAYHGHPARRLKAIGVTGTDGKTTTVHLIAAVLEAAGVSTGYLSSVEFRASGPPQLNATHKTTLESPEVQALLAEMVAAGRQCAVIEASSHGLALNRVDQCEFDVAVFTTLSSDHLDFHGTARDYLAAKARLFEMLDESVDKGVPKTAVLNADDPASVYLQSRTRAQVMMFGIDKPADVRAEDIELEGLGASFVARTPHRRLHAFLPLPGRHSVSDALAALSAGLSLGLKLEEMAPGLEAFPGVPGRMEAIDCGQLYGVVVDIASTPEALRRALEVLRPLTKGRLWAVFGCAGERDPARRHGMGRVTGELADFTVLTNEDPRREDPEAIINDIARGLLASGTREKTDFVRIIDRREAIRYALSSAKPGDMVLLAGKATEQSIVIGTEHHPWDERVVARELLAELHPEAK